MASVFKRIYPSGTEVYRVMFRKKGFKSFSVTFDDWDHACKWAFSNEEKYFKNPKSYFSWRQEEFRAMRQMKIKVRNHLLRAKSGF